MRQQVTIHCRVMNKLSKYDKQVHLYATTKLKSFDTLEELFAWIKEENNQPNVIRPYEVTELDLT